MVTQAGTPAEVYSAPADPWTAGFVGTANLLPGVTEAGEQGETRVRTALGSHPLRGDGIERPCEVTVLIRPEQVILAGALAGTVCETSYHGHDAVVTVDITDVGTVRARTSGSAAPVKGDKVALDVDGPVIAWPS
jgi:iron(III) transport system ATP-binding protein